MIRFVASDSRVRGTGLLFAAAVIELLLGLVVLAAGVLKALNTASTETELTRWAGVLGFPLVALACFAASGAVLRRHFSSPLLLLVPLVVVAMMAVVLLGQDSDETSNLVALACVTVWALVPLYMVWRPSARALIG